MYQLLIKSLIPIYKAFIKGGLLECGTGHLVANKTAVRSKNRSHKYLHIKLYLLTHLKDCTSRCMTEMKDTGAVSELGVNTSSEYKRLCKWMDWLARTNVINTDDCSLFSERRCYKHMHRGSKNNLTASWGLVVLFHNGASCNYSMCYFTGTDCKHFVHDDNMTKHIRRKMRLRSL